jgi:glycosyltransferase involved in cell wall biosynthesis
LRRLSAVHVTRPSEVETARAAGATDVTVLPWTLRDLPPLPRRSPARPYVLAVGRVHPIKGLDRLLSVFALARRDLPDLRLLLAGAGSRRYTARLSAHARSLGVRSHVEFLGRVAGVVLRSYYAEASVLALPSRYENFGMVVLEALREGCPVVASTETPWEVLESSGAGRWIDFEDAPSATSALVSLLRSKTAPTAARSLFEQRFKPERVVPDFASWYARLARSAVAVRAA